MKVPARPTAIAMTPRPANTFVHRDTFRRPDDASAFSGGQRRSDGGPRGGGVSSDTLQVPPARADRRWAHARRDRGSNQLAIAHQSAMTAEAVRTRPTS